MTEITQEELERSLRSYLDRAQEGEKILVTKQGRPQALLMAPELENPLRDLSTLLNEGPVHWHGGKPVGLSSRVRLTSGPSAAEVVLENRR